MASNRKRNLTPARDREGAVRRKKSLEESESLEVFCRICPYRGQHACLEAFDNFVRTVAPPSSYRRDGAAAADKDYSFGAVFDESVRQADVFNRAAVDLVHNLLRGLNSLLFTYGVTGSGKTFTMTGRPSPEETGLLPRTLDVIFNSIKNRVEKCVFFPAPFNTFGVRSALDAHLKRRQQDSEKFRGPEIINRYIENHSVAGFNEDYVCAVFVSYVEIYNNQCYDLLADESNSPMVKRELRQDKNQQIFVDGACEFEVERSDEALEIFCKGEEKRRTSSTLLNKDSSRSHSIFTIKLVMSPRQFDSKYIMPVDDPASIIVSQLCLVDLAGSERAKRTLNVGDRLQEASSINQSLMVLRQCLETLRRNQKIRTGNLEQVPYRQSKLTHLFKNYLEGNGKIRMIICVNPRPEDYEENLGALAFAEDSQTIEVKKQADMVATDKISHRFYAQWNEELDKLQRTAESERAVVPVQPPFCLKDFNDVRTVREIRSYFKKLSDTKKSSGGGEDDIQTIRTFIMEADHAKHELVKLRVVVDGQSEDILKLKSHCSRYKREVASLRQRVVNCEAEEEENIAAMEKLREERLEAANVILSQKKAMKKVQGIIDASSPSVAALRSRFDKEKRVQTTTTTETHAVSSTSTGDLLRTPAHVNGPGYFNPKYQRRSKSASRILDHQPVNQVPMGGIMQSRLPSNAIRVTKPELYQLKKTSEYVLTHQEVDNDGNISANIVKTDETSEVLASDSMTESPISFIRF